MKLTGAMFLFRCLKERDEINIFCIFLSGFDMLYICLFGNFEISHVYPGESIRMVGRRMQR